MHKWITFPHREGVCSKQAHADFPEDAIYEREAGRSGFFGPAAHFHHQQFIYDLFMFIFIKVSHFTLIMKSVDNLEI